MADAFAHFRVWLAGAIAGAVASVPIGGPASISVFSTALQTQHVWEAWMIGLGSSIPEGIFAGLAVAGVARIFQIGWLQIVAGVLAGGVSLGLGVHFMRYRFVSPASAEAAKTNDNFNQGKKKQNSMFRLLAYGSSLTMFNIGLLASWTGMWLAIWETGFLLPTTAPETSEDGWADQILAENRISFAAVFALGAIIGITSWYVFFSTLVNRFKHKLSEKAISRLVNIMGAVMMVGGMFILYKVISEHFWTFTAGSGGFTTATTN